MKKVRWTLMLGAVGVALAGCVDDPVAPPPPPTDAELIHYWHFNNLPEGTLTSVPADFGAVAGGVITYPGTGAGYMDRVDPGSDLNNRMGQLAGFGLRPRNPSNTRELLVVAPSTGYRDVVVQFAVTRTANGATQEEFQYSTDGGGSWTRVGSVYDVQLEFTLMTFDLSGVAAVNNNPNLRFRILFLGETAAGSSGNNRFDNVTIEGVPL